MTSRVDKHIQEKGLVEHKGPEADKPVYRCPGYEGIAEFSELDNRIADALRQARERTGLTHADVAPLLALHPQVYGRYERNETKMTVTRLIHLSELLDFSPIDVIMAAAPYRFGKTKDEADRRRELIKIVEALPADAVNSLLLLVDAMIKVRSADVANGG
ncbi:transcriptional regulator with XRE-family HTH domain [Rhizobium petrolearium]|uniref:helix-turn-helix domain-containing protein n=1 Tax=Neorhizobium petrolearium TaxID=515361 RepID=UPI001AE798C9|nr:helix-turn-helix domain-containing protein [Neorhizobium petrolearium]MBP1844387.1 transcriptional regulator with XRE-family HTH domain [Neorhizobium petrolearium]